MDRRGEPTSWRRHRTSFKWIVFQRLEEPERQKIGKLGPMNLAEARLEAASRWPGLTLTFVRRGRAGNSTGFSIYKRNPLASRLREVDRVDASNQDKALALAERRWPDLAGQLEVQSELSYNESRRSLVEKTSYA